VINSSAAGSSGRLAHAKANPALKYVQHTVYFVVNFFMSDARVHVISQTQRPC
jgi:hypothetical protein